jgi:hypothetical protein
MGLGDALGLIIAHELGHVLLPFAGHSSRGIMQAAYNVRASYALKFTEEQSAAIRAFVAAAQGEAPQGMSAAVQSRADGVSLRRWGTPKLSQEPVTDDRNAPEQAENSRHAAHRQ